MTAPRPAYFANRVLRLATLTALGNELGNDEFALLTVIAMTEDARRYRGPAAFHINHLLQLLGFGKWERLNRVRQKLIDAGWLIYRDQHRRPGLYRVTIPKELADTPDAAVDESSCPESGYQTGDHQRAEPRAKRGSHEDRQGESSYLIPSPESSTSTNSDREAVEVLLSESGYIKAGELAQLAVERRYPLDEMQKLVSYLKAHPEYGKGTLEFRLKNSRPGTPIDKGWPEPRNSPQQKHAQRAGTAKLLAELSHNDIRKDLEWAVETKMLQPFALRQFNDDPIGFIQFPPNQTTLVKVIAARDAAIGQRAPIAQPPPADSSDRAQKRTQRS